MGGGTLMTYYMFESYEEYKKAQTRHIQGCVNWNAGYDCLHTEDWNWKPEEEEQA